METTPQNPKRRDFLLYGLASSLTAFLGMILYPVFRYIMPPPIPESTQNSVKAATSNEIKLNSSKIFPLGSKPAILIHMPDGEYRAFSAVCPHLNCTVQYRDDFKLIWCACHNGRFDLNGKVVSGPPPAGLQVLDVNIQGDDIIVSKKA